jgi:hypothetical protein
MRNRVFVISSTSFLSGSRFLGFVLLLSSISLAGEARSKPFIWFDFNQPNEEVRSSIGNKGQAAELDGIFLQRDGGPTAGRLAAGVSGAPGDFAFDNSDSVMSGPGGTVAVHNFRNALSRLHGSATVASYTVSLWFKAADGSIQGAARLMSLTGKANPIDLRNFVAPGRLASTINDEVVKMPNRAQLFESSNEWTFVAVSVDLTKSENNVRFYGGSVGEGFTLLYSDSASEGRLNLADVLRIGNYPGLDRAFKGYIDDFRLYLSPNDSSGALDAKELENLYLKAAGRE